MAVDVFMAVSQPWPFRNGQIIYFTWPFQNLIDQSYLTLIFNISLT